MSAEPAKKMSKNTEKKDQNRKYNSSDEYSSSCDDEGSRSAAPRVSSRTKKQSVAKITSKMSAEPAKKMSKNKNTETKDQKRRYLSSDEYGSSCDDEGSHSAVPRVSSRTKKQSVAKITAQNDEEESVPQDPSIHRRRRRVSQRRRGRSSQGKRRGTRTRSRSRSKRR